MVTKNFICNICEESFPTTSSLDKHLKIHIATNPDIKLKDVSETLKQENKTAIEITPLSVKNEPCEAFEAKSEEIFNQFQEKEVLRETISNYQDIEDLTIVEVAFEHDMDD